MSGVEPTTSDQSLGELFAHLSSDLSGLMRDEVELAKVELKAEIGRAGKAGGLLGGAALAGYMVVVLLSFAAAWGLAEVMPEGFAFLIVGVVWAAVAAALFVSGRKQLSAVQAVPPQTKQSLKEDVEWARQQKS